ncbi:unnamed protein product [Amoebophrya sp. A120]|nr:unnamed protein product [Amoebophrya sp. A120]|eukprot:GSA120T00019391001.1
MRRAVIPATKSVWWHRNAPGRHRGRRSGVRRLPFRAKRGCGSALQARLSLQGLRGRHQLHVELSVPDMSRPRRSLCRRRRRRACGRWNVGRSYMSGRSGCRNFSTGL